MTSQENRPQTTLSGKVRSSLVLRLNVKMTRMIMSAFMAINLLVMFLFFGMMLWKAEEGAARYLALNGIFQTRAEEESVEYFGYTIRRVEGDGKGFSLPQPVNRVMPLEGEAVRRWVSTPGVFPWISLRQRLNQTAYYVTFHQQDRIYQLSYGLGGDLELLGFALLVMVSFELLYLISSLGNHTSMLRKTLKPLTDLAEAAKTLQRGVTGTGSFAQNTDLKTLAGALGDIDAERLDRRIALDATQHELKDLAEAINDMLNRIHLSYQSQVRFVADASHELRTPISVIQGYANLLDRWGKQDEKVMQESIDAIKAETENMTSLVEQLLFLARGDSETMQLRRESFDVCGMVEEIIRETKLADHLHEFEMRIPPFVEFTGDKHLMKQALRILVDNSVKYTPTGEKIRLSVEVLQEEVKIQVQDSGIGISPEDLPHIFDRFYRSDESRARKNGGAGLGLAIAKWIIERHHGHMQVISRVDIGTRTTVTLPKQ